VDDELSPAAFAASLARKLDAVAADHGLVITPEDCKTLIRK